MTSVTSLVPAHHYWLTIPVIIAGLSCLLWYRVRAVMVRHKKTSVAGCD